MGVKRHFSLLYDGKVFLGPKAYYKLAEKYKRYHRDGYFTPSFDDYATRLPAGGWRKKIVPLYHYLRDQGVGVGTLQELKTCNSKRDLRHQELVGLLPPV